MQKVIKLMILLFVLIFGVVICLKNTTLKAPYFNKGVYRVNSFDNKSPNKNYFYVFDDEISGHTEEEEYGIGLPFSCVQKDGYIKFQFGGIGEAEEIFKIKSKKNGVVTGYFEDDLLLEFTPLNNN